MQYTPPKFNIDSQNDGLGRCISFEIRLFWVSMLNFRGVKSLNDFFEINSSPPKKQVSVSFHESARTIPPHTEIKSTKAKASHVFMRFPQIMPSLSQLPSIHFHTFAELSISTRTSSPCLKQMDVGSLCGGRAFRQRFHSSSILIAHLAPINGGPSKQTQQHWATKKTKGGQSRNVGHVCIVHIMLCLQQIAGKRMAYSNHFYFDTWLTFSLDPWKCSGSLWAQVGFCKCIIYIYTTIGDRCKGKLLLPKSDGSCSGVNSYQNGQLNPGCLVYHKCLTCNSVAKRIPSRTITVPKFAAWSPSTLYNVHVTWEWSYANWYANVKRSRRSQGDVLLPSFCSGYSSRARVFGKTSALNMEILNTSRDWDRM